MEDEGVENLDEEFVLFIRFLRLFGIVENGLGLCGVK